MTRPKRTCTEPGCPTLVTKGYCLRHNRNRRLRERGAAQQRETMQYYDRRWKELRKIILARDPICKICNERPSIEVDHIIPRSPTQHAADVMEEELQGLCKPCHSRKTCAEQRGPWDFERAVWKPSPGLDRDFATESTLKPPLAGVLSGGKEEPTLGVSRPPKKRKRKTSKKKAPTDVENPPNDA